MRELSSYARNHGSVHMFRLAAPAVVRRRDDALASIGVLVLKENAESYILECVFHILYNQPNIACVYKQTVCISD